MYLLCGLLPECMNHLFFYCTYSQSIWRIVMSRLSISNSPHRCHELINWLLSAQLDRNTRLAALQGWQATIYTIWQYINDRFHWGSPSLLHNLDTEFLIQSRQSAQPWFRWDKAGDFAYYSLEYSTITSIICCFVIIHYQTTDPVILFLLLCFLCKLF